MLQRVVFILIFLAQAGTFGFFGLQCRKVYEPPALAREVYFYQMTGEVRKLKERMQELWTSQGKARFVADILNKQGVEAEVRRIRQEKFPYLKESMVVIPPNENGSYLNFLAFKMQQNFGVEMVYSSKFSKGVLASYSPKYKRIYITDYSALTGLVDQFLMHEIRHAAMDRHEDQNQHDVVNGEVKKLWLTEYPWLQTKGMAYKNRMSLQEFRTFYQDRSFAMKEFLRRLKFLRRAEDFSMGIDHDLLALSAHEDVYEQTLAVLEYFDQNLGQRDVVKTNERIKEGTIEVETNGWNYFGHLFVPQSFVKDLKEKEHLPTPLGKETEEYVVKAYLKTFLAQVEEAKLREEKYEELKKILDVAKNFTDKPGIFARAQKSRSMQDLLRQVDGFAAELNQLRADKKAQLHQMAVEQGLSFQSMTGPELRKKLNNDRKLSARERKFYDRIIAVKYTYQDNGKLETFYGGPSDIKRNFSWAEEEGITLRAEVLLGADSAISPAEAELRQIAEQVITLK
jgi:hypothetical protein